jgi:hypothetical protein
MRRCVPRRGSPGRESRFWRLFMTGFLVLGLAAQGSAQEEAGGKDPVDAGIGPREQLAKAFHGGLLDALLAEIRTADSTGLPTRPLALKALEGRSKGADDARILEAVGALRERLAVAADVLGPDRPEDVLVAAAGALYVGVGPGTLGEMSESTRGNALGMALVVVGDLVRRGVAVTVASRAVLTLGAAGATPETLSEFRRRVDEDIGTGLTPERATEVRMRGILSRIGGPGGDPEVRR